MRTRLLLGALLAFVVAFAVFALSRILPPEPYGLADDWRVFYAAGTLVQHGVSPYDPAAIHAAEQAAQHYPAVQPSLDDFADLPVVGILLRAVVWLPFWLSFAVFTALGAVLAALALRAWLRADGWRGAAPWLAGAMLSWPALLGFFSGQFDALLLAGAVGSLLLMRRRSPWAAGVCTAVVLLKPHLLWPLPLLMVAAWAPDRARAWRFLAASAATLAGGAAVGFALVPGSGQFFSHLLGFGSRVSAVQPDLAGLPGTVQHLPGGGVVAALVTAAGAGLVLALAVAALRPRLRALSHAQRVAIPLIGLGLWLACAPYAHPNDDVLLFPLLALVVGVDGARLRSSSSARIALASLAVLPTVWPFHVLTVPVTPIAVTALAIAGVVYLRQLASASDRAGITIPPRAAATMVSAAAS